MVHRGGTTNLNGGRAACALKSARGGACEWIIKETFFFYWLNRLSLEGTVVDAVVSVRLGAVVRGTLCCLKLNGIGRGSLCRVCCLGWPCCLPFTYFFMNKVDD